MRHFLVAFALTAAAAGAPAYAAPADILDANRAASGADALAGKVTLKTSYAYSGQGMTGKIESLTDLKNGRMVDSYAIGPGTGAQGYDGTQAWMKDASGAVTPQAGGDSHELSINETYRRDNLWWNADRGGAAIVDQGEKTDKGETFDVLTVTPKDGKPFDAWFDAKSHLLARTIEKQGSQTVTTDLSGYRSSDGVMLAGKTIVSDGDPKYDQTMTLVSASFLPAQNASVFAMPSTALADFSFAGGAKETTFPFRLINNHIYADVKINGKGPYTFIFDTGGVNVVTPALAQKLALKSEGKMDVHGGGSGSMEAGLTKVAEIRLGDASIKDKIFIVLPLDSMANTEGFTGGGMVGFETFHRFVTRIDYGANTMTLIDPKSFDAKDAGTPVALTFNGNTPEIEGSYAGVPGKFDIDTGSRAELMLTSPFVAKNNLKTHYTKGVDAVIGWGVGGPSRGFVVRGEPLKIGDVEVTNVVTALSTDKAGSQSDATFAGNIGGGILRRFVVTLDYGHNTMYLKPASPLSPDIGAFDRAGLWMNTSADGFAVVDVTPSAPAEAAGLKAGDTIVAVDGKPAKSLMLYDLRKRLRDEAAGTIVTFTVKRGGENKDVLVTLRDLI